MNVRYFLKTHDTLTSPRSLNENEESKKIRVSLEDQSIPSRMRERLIMELRRVTGFTDIVNGKGVPEENISDVKKILAGKKSNSYFASDILSLKRKGVDIVPLLLADPYSPDRAISSNGLGQSQRLYVNFGDNPHLSGTIGAGDILPPEISVISVSGNIGIRRESPRPGYYGENGFINIAHGDIIQIIEKRNRSEGEMDDYREASHKRWALVRASDMIEYNNKNPLTDLPEDRGLFSDVVSLSKRVDRISNTGRSRRDSLNSIKNGFSMKVDDFRNFAQSQGFPGEKTEEILRVMTAIFRHESGGNYYAQGPELAEGSHKGTRAIGRYQIMPINWQAWTGEIFSTTVQPTPENQDKVAFYQMMKNYLRHSKVNSSPEYYVREMALDWYGRGRISATTDSRFNGSAPSTKQYSDRIFESYRSLA